MRAIHLNLVIVAAFPIETLPILLRTEGPRRCDKSSRFVGRNSYNTLKDYVTDTEKL
jgi:hypothetical protein